MLSPSSSALPVDDLLTLDELQRRHILRVLDACKQQRARAAQILGIDRKTLYRRLLAYGVHANDTAAPRQPTALP